MTLIYNTYIHIRYDVLTYDVSVIIRSTAKQPWPGLVSISIYYE